MLVAMNSTAQQHPDGVEDTLRDFWASRPRRPRQGRKIAGVAVGIAHRYGIDPVLVRVAFVVAALFGGAGAPVYLLCWLLFADETDEVSPLESLIGRGRSSTSPGFVVLLCIAMFCTLGMFGIGWWPGGRFFASVVGIALLAGGLFLLHRSRGAFNRPAAFVASSVGATGSMGSMGEQSVAAQGFSVTGEQGWDPLGAPPLAWDLPDSEPTNADLPPTRPRRRRSAIPAITFGLAVISAAVCVGLSGSVSWLTAPHIIGIALGVLGVGLVAGSFVRAGRGLVGLTVLLAVLGAGATVTHTDRWYGVGDKNFAPKTIGEVQPSYRSTAGDLTVDLRGLPNSGTVHTTVQENAGHVMVLVPASAEVTAHCHSGAGQVSCLGREDNGPGADARASANGGGPLTIDLDVSTNAGQVEVSHG